MFWAVLKIFSLRNGFFKLYFTQRYAIAQIEALECWHYLWCQKGFFVRCCWAVCCAFAVPGDMFCRFYKTYFTQSWLCEIVLWGVSSTHINVTTLEVVSYHWESTQHITTTCKIMTIVIRLFSFTMPIWHYLLLIRFRSNSPRESKVVQITRQNLHDWSQGLIDVEANYGAWMALFSLKPSTEI